MKDWKTLLTQRSFLGFWLTLVCYDFGAWFVIATLPILVAERFGTGTEIVISMAARILPRILLAPLAGAVLRKMGAARVAGLGMAVMGAVVALLPWCDAFALLQAAILTIGVLAVFITPALLTLRAPVTPRGLEMASNTLFFSADRLAKFAGPALGGAAVMVGFPSTYLAIAAITLTVAIPVARIRIDPTANSLASAQLHVRAVLREFRDMLRDDAILVALLACAVPYTRSRK